MTAFKFFSPKGRIGRLGFVKGCAITLVGYGCLHLALALVHGRDGWHDELDELFYRAGFAPIPILLVLGVYFWAQQSRRMHDLGHSAWWLLALYVPPVVFAMAADASSRQMEEFWMGLMVIWISALFADIAWALIGRGQPGPNRFGAVPQERLPGPLARWATSGAGQLNPVGTHPLADVASPEPATRPAPYAGPVSAEPTLAVSTPGAGPIPRAPDQTSAEHSKPAARPAPPPRSRWHVFSFAGRYGRKAFGKHVAVFFALAVVVGLLMSLSDALLNRKATMLFKNAMLVPILLLAWYLLASVFKRLHDTNWSSRRAMTWFALGLFSFIGYPLLWLVDDFIDHPFQAHFGVLQVIGIVALLWGIGVCIFRGSCPYGNAHGPAP